VSNAVKLVSSGRKARGEGPQRRKEILAAAEKIFLKDGYKGATIRKIADEVGVSPTALYLHFPDKHAMLLEISATALESLLENFRGIQKAERDPMIRLRRFIRAYIEFAFDQPTAYQLLFGREDRVPGEGPDLARQLGMDCYSAFLAAIEELQLAGRLKHPCQKGTAQVIWGACHGLVTLTLTSAWFDWAPMDGLIDLTIDSLIEGHFRSASA